MPADARSARYRDAVKARSEMAAALTPRASRALQAWTLVRTQVTTLNPNATKAEDIRVKLDTDAILAGLDLAEVEASDRAWAWRAVLMLHDVSYHDGGPDDVCSEHGVVSDVEYEPTCDGCRVTFGQEE